MVNMVAVQASSFSCSSRSSSSQRLSRGIEATFQDPKLRPSRVKLPRVPERDSVEELRMRSGYITTITAITEPKPSDIIRDIDIDGLKSNSKVVVAELYTIMEAIADRIEIHANIGEQRNNWNC